MTLLAFLLAAPGFASEPLLQKPLPMARRIVALDEALKEATKATGMVLLPSRALADKKLVLYTDGLSASLVLVRIADVLGGEWRPEGRGYRLTPDPASMAGAAALEEEMRQSRMASLEATMRGLVEHADEAVETLDERAQRLERQMRALSAAGKGDSPELRRITAEYDGVFPSSQPDSHEIGGVLAQLRPAGWDALRRGDLVVADSRGGAPYRLGRSSEGEDQRMVLWMDGTTGTLRTRVDGKDSTGTGGLAGRSTAGPVGQRFIESENAWEEKGSGLPETPLAAAEPPRPWTASRRLGAVDALEWLHRASRLPVVAEANRRPLTVPPTFAGADLRRWADTNRFLGYALRVEDGVLTGRLRPFPIWHEPAESVLRPLEEKKAPTFDDYARVATALDHRRELPLLAASAAPLERGLVPLRFAGRLSPAERASALSGQPLAFSSLGSEGRRAYLDAVTEGIFALGDLNGRFVDALLGGAPWAGDARLGFFVSRVSPSNGSFQGPDGKVWPSPPTVRMTFGFGLDDGVSFTVSMPSSQ